MKYFYVISNLSKDYVLDVQDEVQSCLEKRGAVCRYMTDYERMKNGRHTPGEYVPEDTQCIITIGGDGTLIQAARDLAGRNIPMLGINRGHLGFLNQVDRTEDIDAAMDALVNERFRLEHRMMLRGTVFHEGKPVFQDIALNEIIATSAEHLRVLRYDLAVNDEYLNELKGKLKKSEERLQKECEGLSKIRKKEAKLLQAKIAEGLQDLNFLDVCFEIRFSKTSGYTVEGTDEVEFMISMNPGEPTRPLATVASGGELSRIMLAIKAVMADKDEIETLIFDEIDVGISGRTAQKVSEKMCLIGRKHQVICITHLAQIAAMADTHYLIEKRVEDQMTKTKIRQLDGEESVQELGRILGGAKITDAVLKNAREMKILASGLKK